ncbi:MAG: ACT domain-containing protein [Acidimicrobiaceae bacterium]|nr:ACT domain-containing protein [Acidimicrobiaceae bacterium]
MEPSEKLICFTGPKGTSDYRAIKLFESVEDFEALPMPSVSEVIQTVNFTPGCYGILPMENSTDGEMTTILDKLIFSSSNVRIQGEVVLAEGIASFGLADLHLATSVVSHPMILDLSSRFIKERGLVTRHALSTSDACRMVVSERDSTLIALAPPEVGEQFELTMYASEVSDVGEIRTRYVLIGQEIPDPTGADKTSLVITPGADRVGSLSEVAKVFADYGVNMLSILSRPLQAKIGMHSFYLTCEGHISQESVSLAVQSLLKIGASVKLLGSYPKWKGAEVTTPFYTLPQGSLEPNSLGL